MNDFELMETRPNCESTSSSSGDPSHRHSYVGLQKQTPQKGISRFEGAINSFIETIIQFLFAVSGGGALIAPMLIMVLHPSRNTSLITTCVFVFAFALALATFNSLALYVGQFLRSLGLKKDVLEGVRLQAKDILGATAAYAAVLVVFVGTSTTVTSTS
jgi:hypothetical protein